MHTDQVTAKRPEPAPGPDDLAPGWRSSGYTVEGRLRQLSMITDSTRRRPRGWRARIGTYAAVIVAALVLVPAGAALLQWVGTSH